MILDYINNAFTVIGSMFVAFVVFYLVFATFFGKKLQVGDPKTNLSYERMPALKPVPIPTKNGQGEIQKHFILLFSVRRWQLTEDWIYKIAGKDIVIPKGFTFDGASIPRPFWGLLSPVGLLLIPGLIHDFGYKYDRLWQKNKDGTCTAFKKDVGKQYWDQLFRSVGNDVNQVKLVNFIAWLGVFLGGKSTWNNYREINLTAPKPELSFFQADKLSDGSHYDKIKQAHILDKSDQSHQQT